MGESSESQRVISLCVLQTAKGNSVPLGPDALWVYQHPDVSAGVTMDARSFPSLHVACASAGAGGTASGGRAPL